MIYCNRFTLKIILALYSIVLNIQVYGIERESIWIFPNKGQLPENVQFHIDINQGDFYIDNKGFTFSLFETPKKHHHTIEKKRKANHQLTNNNKLKGQTIRTTFLNANLSNYQLTGETSSFYKNYFNKDFSYSRIYGKNNVKYKSIYDGIDLELSTNSENFKYNFLVAPFKNTNQIKQKIEGALGCYVDQEGNLHHKNLFGEIIEKKPKAWSILADNKIKEINVEFKLINNEISYFFPNDYDKSLPLVIDPELIFSSFTGSTSDNWGFTATNDNEGNLYSAGICFGIGYPTTIGVFDINYHDGEIYQILNNDTVVSSIPGFDVTISKFSKDGKSLIYSSYLGGNGNETPNSIIVNKQNELYVFGATSSSDFPTTSSAFDKTYNGGTEFKTMDFYFSGSDIFITRFSENGEKLLASTYIGGTNNDGICKGDLVYNYGDNFRGEINITSNEEILIISTTNSSDFPLNKEFQNTLNGNNDAVVFKLSSNLDHLFFSSYLGGLGEETGNSIQYSFANNKIYITGGTTSSDITSIKGKTKNNYFGGISDGYIGIINNQSYQFESFRFIGTSSYDQLYFVQLDSQLNTYVFGQTEGKIGISQGKYGNPNSGQFISKFNEDLSQFLWSTTIGGQSGFVEISPTAFLVSECNDIFIAGWGSDVNQYEKKALHSSTLNFPVTEDAFQKITEGDNFYLAVLSNDGENLKYGSFFGGIGKFGSHVDGGTSRFDKKGGIYHAVCGGCGGNPSGFTTTPNVWSEENKSPNCNLAAFKIELNKISAEASISDSIICSGGEIKFINTSKYADVFEWDFGDNTNSYEKNPTHSYKNEGKYKVKLISKDSKKCILPDTAYIEITVNASNINKNIPISYLCNDTIVNLEMEKITDATYNWFSEFNIPFNEKSNKLTIQITPPMTIKGTTIDNCTSVNYDFKFEKLRNKLDYNHDFSICLGDEIVIDIGKVNEINWKDYPDWKNKSELTLSPSVNSTLFFSAKTIDGCKVEDSLHIVVLTPSSKLINFKDTLICLGDSIKINTRYITNFSINPFDFTQLYKNTTYIKPRSDRTYLISYTDPCGSKKESFSIKIRVPYLRISNDTAICYGDSIILRGSNMKTYEWQNYEFSTIQKNPFELKVSPEFSTDYTLIGKDDLGCIDIKKTKVSVNEKINFKPIILQNATWENPSIIKVIGDNLNSIKWIPKDYLSNDSSFTVYASIYKNQMYSIIVTDKNNCQDSALIYLDFEASLYIPNAFYPNSINGNAIFKAVGLNIRDFEMEIYNRWGELLKTLNNIDEGWDGIYKNEPCPNDVYIWKVKYLTDREETIEKTGHVTLIR